MLIPAGRLLAAITLSCCLGETSTAATSLLVNGGFEAPILQDRFSVPFFAGSSNLTGWTILQGSVEQVRSDFFLPFEGSQSLDLDGTSPGSIEQHIATVIGRPYRVAFAYGNNARGGSMPAFASFTIRAGAVVLVSESLAHGNSTLNDMHYVQYSRVFMAASTGSVIRFTSTDTATSNGGIALDDVAVVAVPEPSSAIIVATVAAMFRSLRGCRIRRLSICSSGDCHKA